MKRLILALCILISASSFAQTADVLSKKEIKAFIAELKGLLSDGQYQKALEALSKTSPKIEEKSVPKSELGWWQATKDELANKEAEFKSNDNLVRKGCSFYYKDEYWQANETTKSLNLDNTCAFKETIDNLAALRRWLSSKIDQMDTVNGYMPKCVEAYKNGRYEETFALLQIDNVEGYMSPENLKTYKEMLPNLERDYDRWMDSWNSIVSESELYLKRDVSTMAYKEAREYYSFANKCLKRIEASSLYFPESRYPIMAKGMKDTQSRLSLALPPLKERMNETDPKKIIMGGHNVSRSQIEANCIDDNFDISSVLDLNVKAYYGLRFDSALKEDIYKHSDEYKEQLSELQETKDNLLNSVLVHKHELKLDSFSLENNSFNIFIGSNQGTYIEYLNYVEAYPPQTVGHDKGKKVVHESLPVVYMMDKWITAGYKNGDKYRRYCLAIPVNKEIAVYYEKTYATLIICYMISGVKTYPVTGLEYDNYSYYIFNAEMKLPYSKKCRVLLYANDGTLLFDKVY